MAWRRFGGCLGLFFALGAGACAREEEPLEPPTKALSEAVTSGPCSFIAPPPLGTPTNRTFTIKVPNGTTREDFAVATSGGALMLGASAQVVKDPAGYASVSSVEATNRLLLGASSKAHHAYSELTGIEVSAGAHLYGDARTASTVIRQAGSLVDGTTTQNTSLKPLVTSSWEVSYPGNTRGNCTIGPALTQIIDPGSYGAITVGSSAHLKLRSGTYYFRGLTLNATAVLDADNTVGPVYIYIRDTFSFNGTVVPTSPTQPNVLFGYSGTSVVNIQGAFWGVLVAPSASVTLGSATHNTGSFFARTLTAQSAAVIHHRAFGPATFCPGSTACSALCPCGPGGACQSNAECQAGLSCTAGTCQSPVIDDGNPCTADTVEANGTIIHTPLPAGTNCADSNLCDGQEVCNAAAQCLAGTPPVIDDGNLCTIDACTPADGITHAPVASGTSCSNGSACDGDEICDAGGSCVAGTPPAIDDGNPCTTDACSAQGGVTHDPLPTGTSCADNNVCNGAEACNATGSCSAGTPPTVDDQNACTADSCDAVTGIHHTPVAAGTSCADADLCNGSETCNVAGVCVAGSPSQVDDGNPCTLDACTPGGGVTHTPVATGTSCDDGDLCNGNSTCNAAAICVAGTPPVVDDGNPCSSDGCNSTTGVTHTPVEAGTSCDDADACNGSETCNGSASCLPGSPLTVDDQNPCTVDTCDPSNGVTHTPLAAGTNCADADLCNGAEICTAIGTCGSGSSPAIDDGNPCTADSCDSSAGVQHVPVPAGTSCADANVCNGAEACNATGLCEVGPSLPIDDANPCTSDSCDPSGGVQHTPVSAGTGCSDGDVCNGAEACNGIGACDQGTPLVVDDGSPCTADACDPVTGVSHAPVPAGTSCADSNACNGSETCSVFATCLPGTPLSTDDSNPCTVDACDPSAGVTHTAVAAGTSCTDGNACNGNETCNASAQCQGGTPIAVDDDQPCTADACDPTTGEVTHTPAPSGAPCEAIDACHDAGTCTASGLCTAGPPLEIDDGDPCTIELCDPENGITQHSCAPIDPTVATVFADANAWIYSGANPLQTGVAAGTIDRERAILLKGHVTDREGLPIPNVAVTVLNHPELGSTLTHVNGNFVMVVNGGSQLVVQFRGEGYLSADRVAEARIWSDDIILPEVVLLAPDPVVTAIDLDDASVDFQVAQGSIITDDSGTRQGTLLFPAGTEATMELPDGDLVPISSLSVRATEFTTGAPGFSAMPGSLPPDSAYTYAFELNADEAVEAGSPEITFSNPLIYYVENFLDFPAGTNVPVGSYDRNRGVWAAEPNGRVIQIVSISGGAAQVNIDANPAPESSAQLAAFGITPAEQEQLAALYATGTSLWRIPIAHFTSPWDANWSFSPPDDATASNGGTPTGDPPIPGGCKGTCCPAGAGPSANSDPNASLIECQTQVLGETVPIAGTPWSLHYSSRRVPGRTAANKLHIPISGAAVPATLKRAEVAVEVAGRQFNYIFSNAPNQSMDFTWDGLDTFGRKLNGSQVVDVTISFVYDGEYVQTERFGYRGNGVTIAGDIARREVHLQTKWSGVIGVWEARGGLGLGGWSLSPHHTYELAARRIHLGTGGFLARDVLPNVASHFAGTGTYGHSGDGGPSESAAIGIMRGLSGAPDGSVYMADYATHVIRRVDRDGTISTVAGTFRGLVDGGFAGDQGPATQALLWAPSDVEVALDGSLYIADLSNHRVRKVDPSGIITTIAGTGVAGNSGDGGPASQARLNQPWHLALGPDGSLYVSTRFGVRRILPDGTITTAAGNGVFNVGPTPGAIATQTPFRPWTIAVGSDGTLYVEEGPGPGSNSAVVEIRSDNIVRWFAGSRCASAVPPCERRDGMPATEVALSVRGLAVSNDGSVLISDANTGRIRTVGRDGIIRTLPITNTSGGYGITGTGIATLPDGSLVGAGASVVQRARPALPGIGAAGALIVASSDGTEVYTFDPAGKHLQTIDARTASVKTSFAYDSSGLLSEIADANANVTIIERDLTGTPTAIVGQYGHRTELSLDANGYLAALRDPLGGQIAAGYSPSGLMMSFANARGQGASMSYDTDGRLQTDTDTAGGTKTLNRVTTSSGFNIAKSTSLGRTTTYQVATLASGENAHTNTFPDGSASSAVFDDLGNVNQVAPDGTTTTTTTRPDPRFGAASPIESQVIQTPAGLVMSLQRSRSVTLADDDDPLSVETISDSTNVNGRIFTTTYNASTRTSVHRTHVGRQFTTRYDEQGRVIETTPSGLTGTGLSYDSRGRLSTITQGSRTQTHSYFANGAAHGFLQSITDALSETTTYGRDARGRELLETAPDGALTAFDWDADSNLTGVTPPSRPRHAMGYSPVNLLTTYDPPVVASVANAETTYEYDLDRNLTIETRPDGSVLSYAYDTAGRLATVTTPDGVVTNSYFGPTPCIGCSPGKRQQVTSTDGVALTFSYDGPLLTSTTWFGPIAGSVEWTHNNNFATVREDVVTNAGTSTQLFDHDNDGLLRCASSTNCLPPAADALSITHHPSSGLLTQVRLGSITENFGYTSFGELATQTATFGGSPLFSEVYDTAAAPRDALGRITRKTETLQGAATVFDYSYDDRGRLESVTTNGSLAVEYTYDPNGNRTSATTPSGTITASYDDQDRLLTYGTLTFAYGANGELETKTDTSTGEVTEYDYDVFGNLKRVDLPNGGVIEYVVDGQHRRVGKRRNGALVQQWLYRNQLNPVAELDGAGNLVARFVYGARHTPEYVIRNDTEYRILADQVGSTRLVVDAATGTVAQRLEHDAFGNVIEDSNPGFVPFGFAGGMYDAETGLVRFGARDYDPAFGRWGSKDPVRFGGDGPNLYAYVVADPVNRVDDTGRFGRQIARVLAFCLGYAFEEGARRYPHDSATRHCYSSCLASRMCTYPVSMGAGFFLEAADGFKKDWREDLEANAHGAAVGARPYYLGDSDCEVECEAFGSCRP